MCNQALTSSSMVSMINAGSITGYGNGFKIYHNDGPILSLVPCLDYTVKAPITALLVDGGLQVYNIVIPCWLKVERNNNADWAMILGALESKLMSVGVTMLASARRGGRISSWDAGYAFGIGQTPLIQLLNQPNVGPSIQVANREMWVDVLVDTRADYAYALAETIALYLFTKEDKPIDLAAQQVSGRICAARSNWIK